MSFDIWAEFASGNPYLYVGLIIVVLSMIRLTISDRARGFIVIIILVTIGATYFVINPEAINTSIASVGLQRALHVFAMIFYLMSGFAGIVILASILAVIPLTRTIAEFLASIFTFSFEKLSAGTLHFTFDRHGPNEATFHF